MEAPREMGSHMVGCSQRLVREERAEPPPPAWPRPPWPGADACHDQPRDLKCGNLGVGAGSLRKA